MVNKNKRVQQAFETFCVALSIAMLLLIVATIILVSIPKSFALDSVYNIKLYLWNENLQEELGFNSPNAINLSQAQSINNAYFPSITYSTTQCIQFGYKSTLIVGTNSPTPNSANGDFPSFWTNGTEFVARDMDYVYVQYYPNGSSPTTWNTSIAMNVLMSKFNYGSGIAKRIYYKDSSHINWTLYESSTSTITWTDTSLQLSIVYEEQPTQRLYVNCHVNGGTAVLGDNTYTQDFLYYYTINGNIEDAIDITKAGYEFLGWYTNDNRLVTTLVLSDNTEVLNATWRAIGDNTPIMQYRSKISLYYCGGTRYQDGIEKASEEYYINVNNLYQTVLPSYLNFSSIVPIRDGYTFAYWSDTYDGSSGAINYEKIYTGDINLYAIWVKDSVIETGNEDINKWGAIVGSIITCATAWINVLDVSIFGLNIRNAIITFYTVTIGALLLFMILKRIIK